VPMLWRYKVCAVLARAEINGLLPSIEADEFIQDLAVMRIIADSRAATEC
jgi:hypothetical protein